MIFSFWKRKNTKHTLPKVDIHSHLIPIIDDGAKSLDESIEMIKGLKELGYQKIFLTPHIMSDSYPNDFDTISHGLKLLEQKLKEESIDIKLDIAAEYYLDDGFTDKLKQTKLLTLNDTYILIETSYISKPLQFETMIFDILTLGYTPILAHPERYLYIKDYSNEYQMLKSLGILFQCDINSFGGYYGQEAKQKAIFLSQNGMIDFLGTDIHHLKHLKTLQKVRYSKVYQEIYRYNDILNDTLF